MASSTSKPLPGRLGHPQRLGDSIKAFVQRAGRERPLMEQRILSSWEEVVEGVTGDRAGVVSRSERIQANELIVRVSDPVWRHRLRFEEQRFVKMLNEMAGGQVIRSIRFI